MASNEFVDPQKWLAYLVGSPLLPLSYGLLNFCGRINVQVCQDVTCCMVGGCDVWIVGEIQGGQEFGQKREYLFWVVR
jgi:hypothetical protein